MKKIWLVPLLLAGGTLGIYRASGGCLNSSKDPDQKLAARFDDLCKIADDGAGNPVKGVKKLGRYFSDHTGDMLGDFGDTFAMIEKISDDDAHDDRAVLARERMAKPWIDCLDTWERFGNAIRDNEEASEMMERSVERIGRTLEIIIGENTKLDGKDFRRLPALLIHRFDALR